MSSILCLLLAGSKFSQLGELTVLVTNLYSKGLNSWRAEELEDRITMMRRDNNDNSLKNKKIPVHDDPLFHRLYSWISNG